MSKSSDRVRKEFAANDAVRDAGLTMPDDILRMDDIAYGSEPEQVLDVYRPKDEEGNLPVIVSVHGGGWVYGDKKLYQYYTMNLAQRGFAVVNFSYRLAPETKYPAQLEDVNTVFAFVREFADRFGFDTDNIFGVGDSAGAHLLALYCDVCTNPAYAKNYHFAKPVGSAPKAISLACGAYTIEGGDSETQQQNMELMGDLLPDGVTEESLALIDVRRHITPAFPPVFFFTCTGDFLQEQADILHLTLREQSVPHVLRYYGDAEHSLGHVFHCNIRSEHAVKCNDDQCEFFRKVMAGRF